MITDKDLGELRLLIAARIDAEVEVARVCVTRDRARQALDKKLRELAGDPAA